jgi:hypothetical protein
VMPTVKVLSPEKTALVLADGFKMPAGNSALHALASAGCHPGIVGRVEPDIGMMR